MIVLGIDEVGRGSLAGPLVIGAVVLASAIEGLTDSKLLSKKQRNKFALLIKQDAEFIGLGWVSEAEIDNIGLSSALVLAANRSIINLTMRIDEIIIDGTVNFLAPNKLSRALVKADISIQSVSAASVIAKTERDKYMATLATEYPQYGFDSNMGYGTKYHLEAIRKYGPCQSHRKSFEPIKSFY